MALTQQLIVSETFYSIQGEGVSCGVPAVFLRLTKCNLRCLGFSYQDPQTGEHLGCDSAAVWRQGEKREFADLLQQWQQAGWLQALAQGAHLVITGGEPLLQQKALIAFIQLLDQALPQPCFIEIETNATLLMEAALLARLNQINASPKLSNSLEPQQKCYQPAVLKQLLASGKVVFKFVIKQLEDMAEIETDFIKPFAIMPQQVCLMPEGGNRQAIQAKANAVVELCKQYGFRYSPRLQIDIWGEVTGV